MTGYKPILYDEYASSYYTQPYAAFTGGLTNQGGLQPLPPAINVNDLIQPVSDVSFIKAPQTQPTSSSSSGLGLGTAINILPSNVLGNLSSPLFTRGGIAANAIDKVGTAFGFSNPTKIVGPLQPGQTLSSTITGGTTLAGIAGGVAADILGLSGKLSPVTGTVGTAIGGAVGGPIGAAVGSFLGSAVGGLFKSKKPNPSSIIGSNQGISVDGGFIDGGTTRSKHISTDFAKKMGGLINTFNQSIHLQTGQDLSKTIKTLYSGYDVNSGPGGFISFNGYFDKKHPHHNPNTFFTFDPNNEQSMVQAFRNYGSKLLQSAGADYSPAQIQSIVDKAISSIGGNKQQTATQQSGGATVTRKDMSIAKSIGPANRFSTFLQEYNKQYNSKAIV